jgi:hypothetical protein
MCFDLWIFTHYLSTSNTTGMNQLKIINSILDGRFPSLSRVTLLPWRQRQPTSPKVWCQIYQTARLHVRFLIPAFCWTRCLTINETPEIAAAIGIHWYIGLHMLKVTGAHRGECRLKLARKSNRMVTEKLSRWHRTSWLLLLLGHSASDLGLRMSCGTNKYDLSRLDLDEHSGYVGNSPFAQLVMHICIVCRFQVTHTSSC